MKIIEMLLLIWLLIMAVIDIRKKSFERKSLIIAVIFFSIAMGLACCLHENDWKTVLSGGMLGAFFLLASIVTRGSIGMGDGYILTICGMVIGLYQMVLLLIISLCFASVFGMILWVQKKAGRHTKIPFVPFICVGYGVIFLCSII